MIVRINGTAIMENGVDLMTPKMITGIGGEKMKEAKKNLLKAALPLGHKVVFALALGTMVVDALLGSGLFGHHVAAAAGDMAQVRKAFDPVKQLLLNAADPLCYVMFVWGCIETMVGRAASGLNRMKYAGLGYIAINWIPVLMSIIRSSTPGA